MAINKVILVGNVGRDPEVRYLEKNLVVANFSLATTERAFTTQNGVQVPERTEWHNIVAWRGLAEICEKYIKKGSQLYIEGKLQTRSWEKDGVKRYSTEIYADSIELLGKKLSTENQQVAEPTKTNEVQAPPPVADDLPF